MIKQARGVLGGPAPQALHCGAQRILSRGGSIVPLFTDWLDVRSERLGGCNSLHRVSSVEGDRMRIMGVFVYENEPGVIGDPEVNATIYGRPTAMAT